MIAYERKSVIMNLFLIIISCLLVFLSVTKLSVIRTRVKCTHSYKNFTDCFKWDTQWTWSNQSSMFFPLSLQGNWQLQSKISSCKSTLFIPKYVFSSSEFPAYWCTKRVCITVFWENREVRKHQKSSTINLIRLLSSSVDYLHWPLKSRLTGDKSVLVINNYCKLSVLIMTRNYDGLQRTNYHKNKFLFCHSLEEPSLWLNPGFHVGKIPDDRSFPTIPDFPN